MDHYNQVNSARQRQYAHQYHSSILKDIRIEDLIIRMSEFIQLGYVKCSSILSKSIYMYKCQYVYVCIYIYTLYGILTKTH